MKALLWIAVFALIKSVTTTCFEGDIQLYHTSQDQTRGVVQVCYQGRWLLICEDDTTTWGSNETSVVCQHLGFNDNGSSSRMTCGQPEEIVSDRYLRFFRCPENSTDLTECYFESRTNCNMKCNDRDRTKIAAVDCMNVSCPKDNIRLVDGSTDEEGRVEVCVDGRWRAVCSEGWTQEQAGLLCGKMGFLDYGTEIRVFHPRKAPLLTYNLETNRQGTIDFVCNHTTICDTDLGIKCLSRNLLEQILKQQINTTIPTNTLKTNMTSAAALGGVVGVLLTVLVVLVIGWSLSCVALVKRNLNTQKQIQRVHKQLSHSNTNDGPTDRQLDNPVYGANINTCAEAHNYSSSGPTYELVDTNEGAGQTSTALEQSRESSNAVQTTSEDDEHFYHILECGESEGVTEGGCEGVTKEECKSESEGNYEVPRQTHSRVWLCEEEYSTIEH